MNSFYAVIGQISLSGSNYLVFLIFTFILPEFVFVEFSTAVGLNILAYAVAEGGVSYVAPKEISKKKKTKSLLAGGFILISISLYLVSLVIGYNIWNVVSADKLSLSWVLSYMVYFFPVLLIPSWLTCWAIDFKSLFILLIFKAISVLFVFLYPGSFALFLNGFLFLIFTLYFIFRLNSQNVILSFPTRVSFFVARDKIMEVFVSKTSSYSVYSLMPMVVAGIYGNTFSSYYILGERIKSLYSTLFQPLIQTVYLSINDGTKKSLIYNKLPYLILIINFVLTLSIILLIFYKKVDFLGERFNSVPNLFIYVLASGISVFTSCFLYFNVLPNGLYRIFRVSTYFQMLIFLILYMSMYLSSDMLPSFALLIGEVSMLAILLYMIKVNK
jgi:hypothetical protein